MENIGTFGNGILSSSSYIYLTGSSDVIYLLSTAFELSDIWIGNEIIIKVNTKY